MKPFLTRSGVNYASIYPQPVMMHSVETQADMLLSSSTPTHLAEFPCSSSSVEEISDISYRLSQDTVTAEEEGLSQEKDEDAKSIAGCKTYLVYESLLLLLLRKCYVCGQVVELKTSTRGTLLVVQGSCPDGHYLCWESQPMVKGIAAGSLALSAAILFSVA